MKPITALIIMDGFGCRAGGEGNAVALAGTPHIDALLKKYPHTQIGASGMDVGLPEGQMGNSEVGHLNMGAGRVVYQELTRITKSIIDGDIYKNPALCAAMDAAKESSLHLCGLLSDGGVHSHIDHLLALVRMATLHGLKNVYIHCFMDGRDTPPDSGAGYIAQLEGALAGIGAGKVATVIGRYYAMDRDNRWERIEAAYRAMTLGEGLRCESALEAVQASYARGETDEFIRPSVVYENGAPVAAVKDGDSVIFFNFRPDRARELTRAFTQECGFERKKLSLDYVCMTRYDASFSGVRVAFAPQTIENTLGEYLSANGLSQLRIAETEKYAHVTFFFNGGVEQPSPGEDRALIPSPKVATYDLKPEMSAYEVAAEAAARIGSEKYDVMILNFANADMVGHTGVLAAAVSAVKAVDECVSRVVGAVLASGGQAILTADHGNAEQMTDELGAPFTAHSTNPVPLAVIGEKYLGRELREGGILADVAPTLLDMLGLPLPAEMTGKTLLK